MLPPGFNSRVIARSGQRVSNNSSYIWHNAPDGEATFRTEDNGWIYVSNSEVRQNQRGVEGRAENGITYEITMS